MKYVTENTGRTRSAKTQTHQSMHRALGYLWGGALAFLLTVAVCATLQPDGIWGHYGMSFYGNYLRTFVPYAAGLLTAAYCLFRACRELRVFSETRSFSRGLQWVAAALAGIVVTPSFSSAWLVQDLHVLFGFVIFVTQAVLSLRYLIQARRGPLDWGLLALQLVAIAVVALSFRAVDVASLMLPAQVLAISSFGALLIRAVNAQIGQHSTTVVVENM